MLADGSDPAAAPETLQGVVAARIDALPREEKELLQLAAVTREGLLDGRAVDALGRESPGSWRSACTRSSEGVRAARASLGRRRLEAVRRSSTRSSATVRTGRCLAPRGPTSTDAWPTGSRRSRRPRRRPPRSSRTTCSRRSSTPALRASTPSTSSRAARALRESGDRAWRIGAPERRCRLLQRARELDPSVEDDPYFLLAIGLALAHARVRGGRSRRVERAAEALAISDPAAAAQATMTRGEFVWQAGDQDGAFGYFDRASARRRRPRSRARSRCRRAAWRGFLALAGRYDEALRARRGARSRWPRSSATTSCSATRSTHRGIVRASLGDPGGWRTTSGASSSPSADNSFRAGRAYINLGSQLVGHEGVTSSAGRRSRARGSPRERMGFSGRRSAGSRATSPR